MAAPKPAKQQPQRLNEHQRADALSKRPGDRFARQGWAPLPSLLFTHADKFAPGGAQLLAVQWIMFQQFAQAEVPEWVKVSAISLAKATSGAYDPKSFDLALADAAKRGLVIREKRGREWWYQVFPEDWAAADAYEVLRPIEVPKPAPKAEATPVPEGSFRVATGKTSEAAAVSFQISVAGQSAPVDFSLPLMCRNETGMPFLFRPVREDGALVCCIYRDPAKGEQKANDQVAHYLSNGETKANDHVAHYVSSEKPLDKNQLLSAIRDAVKALFADHFQKPLTKDDEPFVLRVSMALSGAPVSELVEYAAREIPAMRRKKKPVESGLLEYFARQVSARWIAGAADREKSERERVEAAKRVEKEQAAARFDVSNDATPWPQIRESIRGIVGEVVHENWFTRSRGQVLAEGTLLVEVPDSMVASLLHDDYQFLADRKAAEVHAGIERVQFYGRGERA